MKQYVARAHVRPDKRNNTERRYADEILEPRRRGKIIRAYWFEGIKLRLADNTFYTPDYLVEIADGTLEVHEVKGFWREDARVKIKVAAEIFPFRFLAASWNSRGKHWEIEEI